MATIKDVAKHASVSTTTVSHVINRTRFVSETTQKRVWKAVEELNYAPSAVARSLKCNTTNTIGMLVTQSFNPFFAEVIHGVENYCYKQGYTLFMCNTEGDLEKQKHYLRMLAEKRVDGLLVICSDLSDELLGLLKKNTNLPMVIMDWGPETPHSDRIIDNSEEGGYLAAKHLIENGHTHIGCLTGQLDKLTCKERLNGFYRALSEHNITPNPEWIIEGDFEASTASQNTEQLLKAKTLPTALFCFNDIVALAAISKLQQSGLRVPEDISIIGYDNIELAAFFSPPLTTIHQPKRRVGKTAVEILLERIQDKNHERRIFEMQPEVVERSSVCRIK